MSTVKPTYAVKPNPHIYNRSSSLSYEPHKPPSRPQPPPPRPPPLTPIPVLPVVIHGHDLPTASRPHTTTTTHAHLVAEAVVPDAQRPERGVPR